MKANVSVLSYNAENKNKKTAAEYINTYQQQL
jgi:hypothetical protein